MSTSVGCMLAAVLRFAALRRRFATDDGRAL
jgi:hypothetical protein